MTATSMPQGTFSRSGMSVSQEESPGFSRGEDVKAVPQLDGGDGEVLVETGPFAHGTGRGSTPKPD